MHYKCVLHIENGESDMDKKKARHPLYKRWWFWGLAVIVLIIVAAVAIGARNKSNELGSSEKTTSVKMQLTSGNYTAGTDFPSGMYDIVAVSGVGSVSSSNVNSGGINAVMGTKEANEEIGTDTYDQEYQKIDLPEDTIISVSGGVTIEISSDNADSASLKPRQQTITETVTLGKGVFFAGKDFPAGTYDIIAVSGSGNVSSSNAFSGGINAVMGTKETNASGEKSLYEQAYKNIELPDNVFLSIDGVKIQLIPSI